MKMNEIGKSRKLNFKKLNLSDCIDMYEKVKSVLRSRLPQSTHIFNMAQGLLKWRDKISFHTLMTEDDSEVVEAIHLDNQCWIVVKLYREDMGTGFAVSPPLGVEITAEIEEAFSTGGLIDWTQQYHFPALDRAVSPMIMKISAFTKCNITRINPCYFFYKDISDALAPETGNEAPSKESVVVRPLELERGVDFITEQWKYAFKGTDAYLPHVIRRNHTMGVYVEGKVVCGVITHINGTIGGLNTIEEFRRKGYGQKCMHALMKHLAQDGYVPLSSAEVSNRASIEFHEKLGMKLCGVMDYISSPWKDLAL